MASEADEVESDSTAPTAEDEAGPGVTIAGHATDIPGIDLDAFDGETRTVRLPSSDLLAFLKNINLPPQLLDGLGTPSELSGFLTFEFASATQEDPHPVRRFKLSVYGCHTAHLTALNPNQPGYVSEVIPSALPLEEME